MNALLALEPLARTSEGSKAGPIGLAVILLLCIACYFLFKSMSKHMRYVRENFPNGSAAPPAPVAPDTKATSVDESSPQSPAGRPDA